MATVEAGKSLVSWLTAMAGGRRRSARRPAFPAVQELPRVGGEGLDVAALSFGIQGFESQAALGCADAAQDDHPPVRRSMSSD